MSVLPQTTQEEYATAALPAVQTSQIMQAVYGRGDSIMAFFLLAHMLIALCLASFYGTWLITLTVGPAAVALFLVSARVLPGTFLSRCLAGLSLQTFVILHIYQMHGLAEMHFFFFTAFTMMIVYQDWKCLWPGALLIICQHTLFAALTDAGHQLFFFEQSYISVTKLAFHFGIAISQVGVCGYWAFLLRRQTLREAGRARRDGQEEQLRQSLAEAVAQADSDPLTGLLNHRAFHRRLVEEADRALRTGTSLAVAVLDLNNFKFFNDAYGHLAGDDVLRRVAAALQTACRPGDILARYGGDEFTLIAPGIGPEQEHTLAARLRDCVAGDGYLPQGGENEIPLAVSVGVAFFPHDAPGRLDVIAIADKRLMRMKSGGDEEDAEVDTMRASLSASVDGFSMLNALVTAVDNKDRYTARHSEDVLKYSLEIARGLGMDTAAQRTLATAALLHDVGKIGVPDAVLRKPGHLTTAECEILQHHPVMGAVIVSAVPGLEDTLDAIRHHHERWDGLGYPAGLRGEEIPLSARLLAVADAFSAMTTDRPYRKGMAREKALAILAEGAGTQWDPECIRVFLQARTAAHVRSEDGPETWALAA